jgi:hypothetical protein
MSGGGGPVNDSTTVTFTITGGTPTALATKVGSGSFATTTPVNGKVTLSLPAGTTTFAVAYVCPPVSLTTNPQFQETFESVVEASTLDGSTFSQTCPTAPATGTDGFTTGTLTGTVDASAIPGASFLNIDALNGTAETTVFIGTPSGSFSFAAPTGTDNVQVLAYNSVLIGFEQTMSLAGAKVLTGQTVPGALNGGSTVVLGAADQTTLQPITYNNLPAGYSAPTTFVSYLNGTGGGMLIANAATSQYPLLPAGALTSGGFYSFVSDAIKPGATNSTEETLVATTTSSAGPESITFPPEWSYAGPVAAAWPSFDLSYTGFSGKTGVLAEGLTNWSPTLNSQSLVEVSATGNFLNGSPTLAVPDLTGLTGFLPAPPSGKLVSWSASILQGDFPFLKPTTPNGTYSAVSNFGIFTTP